MRVNVVECADHALFQGIYTLQTEGVKSDSRNGPVIVTPFPVVTVNEHPMRRVVFSAQRDANPFFHLNEALWMLAGRNDITWLDQFVGNFSERFGEKDVAGNVWQHGAYGFRWRKHFDMEGGGLSTLPDQLVTVIDMLRKNPDERRAVISMWDPVADLAADKKDIPCNTTIYLRVREVSRKKQAVYLDQADFSDIVERVLDLTVCCRSNDAVWGAHGANVVHFSILQEYLAANIGVGIGKLYQFSNNYHMYINTAPPQPFEYERNRYYRWGNKEQKIIREVEVTKIIEPNACGSFEYDLKLYMSDGWGAGTKYMTPFFSEVAFPMRLAYQHWRKKVAFPMRLAYQHWRKKNRELAIGIVAGGGNMDWLVAAREWFERHSSRGDKVKLEGDQNVSE
jgi:thymidylate synthase